MTAESKETVDENTKRGASKRDFFKTLAGLGLGAAMAQTLYSSLNPKQRAQLVAWAQTYGKPMTYAELGRLIDAAAWDDVVRAVRYQPASYIIYQAPDGSYQAKNGNTGQIEFSGTDAASVIQQAIDAIAVPPTPNMGGKIFIKAGKYYISRTINIAVDAIELCGEAFGSAFADSSRAGTLLFTDKTNIDIIHIYNAGPTHDNRPTGVMIRNLKIQGGGSNAWTNYGGIKIDGDADMLTIKNVQLVGLPAGIIINNADSPFIYGCSIQNNFIGMHIGGFVGYTKIMFCECTDNSSYGIHLEGAQNTKIVGCVLARNDPAIRFSTAAPPYTTSIVGNTFSEQVGTYGAIFGSARGATIVGNHFWNISSNKAIYLRDATHVVITGNIFYDSRSPPVSNYGIYEEFGVGPLGYNQFINNIFYGYANPISRYATTTIVKQNIGYVTENKGVATLAAGSTSVVVNHGLAAAPNSIKITPQANVGTPWVSNITATSFTINVATAPAANVDFYWEAEV